MIKGIDIGNSTTKDEKMHIFTSSTSNIGMFNNSSIFNFKNDIYAVGEGTIDTTYRKVDKSNYIKLLYAMLCISNSDKNVQLVLGLPLSQYKADSNTLKEKIRENFILQGAYNNVEKNFIIEDVEVYPEGIASLDNEFEGVIVDIGGRTTDSCLVINYNKKHKIEKPISLNKGTLSLYSDFINIINNKFSLDLETKDTERILKKGLYIDGAKQDITFAIDIFKTYLEDLIQELNLQYSLKTNQVAFTGGGSLLLKTAIKNRIKNSILLENPLFSNAMGFYKVGCKLWG